MPKINKIWTPVSNAMQCLDDGLSFVQIQPIPNFNFISSQDWNLSVGWIKDQDSDGVLFTQPNSAGGIIPIEIAIKTHALVLSIGSWYKKRQISCGDFLIPEGENRLDLSYQHLPDSKVQISLFLNCILVFQSAVSDVDSISNTDHYQLGLNFSGLITNIRVVNLALDNSAVAQNLYVNHFEREKILLYLDFSQLSPKDQGKYALDYQGEYKARHVNYLATRKFTQDTYLKSQRSLKLENSWTILAKVYWDDHFRPYQVIAQLVAGNASSYEKLADTPAPTTSQPATLELAVVGGKLAIRLANQQIVLDQPFSQSQWMDICLSVDGISSSNNSKVQLFVNGELVQQTSLTPLPALGGTLIIGNSATYSESNDHYWGGYIDSVAIFQTNFGQATAQSYLDIPPYVLDEHIMNFFTVYELYDHARIAAMAQIGSLPTTYALNTYPEIESSTFQFREPEQELIVDNFVAWQAQMLLDAVSANLFAFSGLGLVSEETSNYSNAIINRVGVNLFYGASRFRDSANRLTDPDDPDNVTTLMVDLDAVPKSYRLELGYLATGSKISPGILLAAALLVGCFLVVSSCTTVVAKGGIAGIALMGLLALGAIVTVVIVQCIKNKPDKTDDKIPVAPGYDDLEPYDVKNFFLKSLTFYAGEISKTSSFAVKQSFDQLSKIPEWEVGESTHGVVLYAKQYHGTPKVTATFDFNRKVKDMPITTLNVTVKGSSTLGGSNYPVMGQLTGTVLVSGPGTYTVNLQSDADFKNAPLGKILSAMDWTFTTDEPVRYEGGASKVDVYVIQA
ncbi:MAG: LamG domain-containing protein, partial [Bifidobacteriaceae bacterium]|nr:LamG domain-containing protein [Bifidobacteriaceae bacterium]